MSTWRNVGITYLKYADICATHVRNALKEPAKTKAKSASNMHARIVQWEAGKRGEPREPRPPGPVAPRSRRAGWFAGVGALRAPPRRGDKRQSQRVIPQGQQQRLFGWGRSSVRGDGVNG